MRCRTGWSLVSLLLLLTGCGDESSIGAPDVAATTDAESAAVPVTLVVSRANAGPGERIVVAIRSEAGLMAVQGTLDLDPDRLRYLGVASTSGWAVVGHPTAAGTLSWLSVDPRVTGERDVGRFVFEVVAEGYLADLRVRVERAMDVEGALLAGTTHRVSVDPSLQGPDAPVRGTAVRSFAGALGVEIPGSTAGPARISEVRLSGDCRPDGMFNVFDALDIARLSVGLDPLPADPIQSRLCDADGSGDIDVFDVLDVARLGVGLLPTNPVVGGEIYFVDAEGGTYERGPVSLTIPADALADLVGITAEEATDVPPGPLLDGETYRIAPATTLFDPPAILEISYEVASLPADVSEAALALFELVDGAWVQRPTTLDATGNRLSAELTGLGTFAIGIGEFGAPANVRVRITDVSGGGISAEYEELTPLLYDIRVTNPSDSTVQRVEVGVDVDLDATGVAVESLTQQGTTWSTVVPEIAAGDTWIARVSLTTEAVPSGPHTTIATVAAEADTFPEDNADTLALQIIPDVEPVCGSAIYPGPGGSIRNAEDLAALRRSGLTTAGSVFLEGSTATQFDLPCVTLFGGFLSVRDNPELRTVNLPAAVEFDRGGSFIDNPSLETFSAPLLAVVDVGGSINGNDALTTIDLSSLAEAGSLNVSGAAVMDLRLDRLTRAGIILGPLPSLVTLGLPHLVDVNSSAFRDLPALDSLVLPNVTIANTISFSGSLPPSIRLPALVEAAKVNVVQSSGVGQFFAPLLDSLRIGLEVFSNQDLRSVDLPLLRTSGPVSFIQNPQLQAVDLSSLQHAGSRFTYEGNSTDPGTPPYDLELPSLTGPDDLIELRDNGSMRAFRLPSVVDLSVANGRIVAERNTGLSEVSAPALIRIRPLIFRDNPSLTTLDFPLLEEASGITLPRNAALTTLNLPSLATITSSLNLDSAEALSTLNLPSLTSLSGLSIVRADNLETLDGFSSVTSGMQGLNIQSNASLRDYDGLLNVGDALTADPIFFDVRIDNPLVCRDDAEAFRDALEAKFPGDMATFRNSISGPTCPPPPDGP